MQFLFVLPFGGQCGGGVGRQLADELDRPLEAGRDRPLGRLGSECRAFDPDHLDVGHAEERQELQQVGRDVIELPARTLGINAALRLDENHLLAGHESARAALAETAGTNKMTLYRHFPSKDALVSEYLRGKAKRAEALWERLEAEHPGDPLAQLHAWVKYVADDVISRGNR